MQQNQQQIIIQTARSWLGTKFHHQGRIKKNKQNLGGCDCVGLIIGVGNELNIKPHNKSLNDYDKIQYGRVHKRNQLNTALSSCFKKSATISRGTILVFQINPDLQHCAIASEITLNPLAPFTTQNPLAPEGERDRVRGLKRDDNKKPLTVQTTQPQLSAQIKIIHCDAKAGKVVENNISDSWLKRIIGIYEFSEV